MRALARPLRGAATDEHIDDVDAKAFPRDAAPRRMRLDSSAALPCAWTSAVSSERFIAISPFHCPAASASSSAATSSRTSRSSAFRAS